MRAALAYLAAAAVLATTVGNYWGAHWTGKWAALMWVWAACFSLWVAKRTTWAYLPLIAFSTASGVYMVYWILGPYHGPSINQVVSMALERNSADSLIALLASCFALATIPRRMTPVVRNVLLGVLGLSVLTSLLGTVLVPGIRFTLASLKTTAYERGGFVGNASMNASLIVCLLPLLTWLKNRKLRWGGVAAGLTAVGITQSVVPLGLTAVVGVAYLLSAGYWRFFRRFLLFPTLAAGGVLIVLLVQDKYVTSSGRFEIWSMMTKYWWENGSALLGMGLGSVRTILPIVQTHTNTFWGEWFLWMHNDWLQTSVELGVLGALSAGVAWLATCLMAWSRPALFASLMGWSACAFFNYPLRLPIHAACIVLTVWLILGKGDMLHGEES